MKLRHQPTQFLPLLLLAIASRSLAGPTPDGFDVAEEIKRHPDIFRPMVDWKAPYPALFYRMRIDGCRERLRRKPAALVEYITMAQAQLDSGDSTSAAQTIALLDTIMAKRPKEDTFRSSYCKNTGALKAQIWLKGGAKDANLAMLDSSLTLLKELDDRKNPKRMSLEQHMVRWILEVRRGQPASEAHPEVRPSPLYLSRGDQYFSIDSLRSLVADSPAWHFSELDALLIQQTALYGGNFAYLQFLAAKEREAAGMPKINPQFFITDDYWTYGGSYPSASYKSELRRIYSSQRSWYVAETRRRNDYMLPLLKQGLHPDFAPHFWDGYQPESPPAVPHMSSGLRTRIYLENNGSALLVYLILLLIVGGGIALFVIHLRREKQEYLRKVALWHAANPGVAPPGKRDP